VAASSPRQASAQTCLWPAGTLPGRGPTKNRRQHKLAAAVTQRAISKRGSTTSWHVQADRQAPTGV